jgi:hypothetical protein
LENDLSDYRTVVLSECCNLRELPICLTVRNHLFLRRMGPFDRWPMDFHIGGDLRIQDCPDIEELPALEVSGSVRVEGESGLRRLAPGSVIGRHLDLRACRHLEAIPRGVKVGGCLYLPDHLHWSRHWEKPEPLLEMPVDRAPALRTLLMAQRFPELSHPEDRYALRDRAEAVLEGLQHELCENPGLEAELLWTASEAWRELAEQRSRMEKPWKDGLEWDDEPESDLPLAWFRGLLFDLPEWAP